VLLHVPDVYLPSIVYLFGVKTRWKGDMTGSPEPENTIIEAQEWEVTFERERDKNMAEESVKVKIRGRSV
jgi:hypothetical protein